MDLVYIEYVLRDLFEFEENGFCAHIGKDGDKSNVKWLFPMISLIVGDTLQLDFLMGTNNRRVRRCRICRSNKCWKFCTNEDTIEFRSHGPMEELVRQAGQIKLAKILWPIEKGQHYQLSLAEKQILRDLEDECLTAGLNPLFQLPRWQYRRQLNSLSRMMPPDTLHTVLKGLIEHAVGWTLQIINQVAHLDPTFSNACGIVDDRLRTFPEYEAGFPFRYQKFRKGVFSLVKDASMDAKIPMSAFMLGATLGWHMPSLLYHLTFSIGNYCNTSPPQVNMI